MGKKRRGGGRYCWVCGKHKSNESFTGKGHARHICKKCASLTLEQRNTRVQRAEQEDLQRLLEGGKSQNGKKHPTENVPVDAEQFSDIPYWWAYDWEAVLRWTPGEPDPFRTVWPIELAEDDDLPF